jgi:glucose-6-phosphate isomerase
MGELNASTLKTLEALASGVPSIVELFAADANRSKLLTVDACGMHADFSRQHLSTELLSALTAVVKEVDIAGKFAAMAAGEIINQSEQRAVGHMALRAPASSSELSRLAYPHLDKARHLSKRIRSGSLVGSGGQMFTTIVNIGIGGSDLGPAMATRALRRFADGPECRFVSNIDAADLDEALTGLDPCETLFVVSSKTFTTLETMHNADRAKRWIQSSGLEWTQHCVAATANPTAAISWGVSPGQCLEFFDWVGGRYSLSSVIGFPLMCAIGADLFDEMLAGMHEMDFHAMTAPTQSNIAILHGLVWWANVALHHRPTVAVVPYSHDLGRIPAYLQQLVMESNGKSVDIHGEQVIGHTSPVVWGESGTNGQHAFFQMLHQGTQVVPVEFVSTVAPLGSDESAHDLLFANLIAQSEALAVGSESPSPHKVFSGNRPSTVILLDELTPRRFGSLISMYENSTAVQGWLMGVNSFDQWGVELGKTMAVTSANAIRANAPDTSLSLTHPLMQWYLDHRKK